MEATDTAVDALVVGGGVLGACVAATLTERGLTVRLVDPGGPNASAVAAGMIAPGFEAALEPETTLERAELFRAAAALWPAFAARHGLTRASGPARWRGEGARALYERLLRLGFAAVWQDDDLLVPDERQVDAGPTLAAIRSHASSVAGSVTSMVDEGGEWRVGIGSTSLTARAVVLALGAAAPPTGLPADIDLLVRSIQPIRGQIGRTSDIQLSEVVRGPGVYLAPTAGGVLIGATMEPGRRDLEPDEASSERLVRAAEALLDRQLDRGRIQWTVGVRGAVGDGLPLAGATSARGLFMAMAPRRNGWLFGPLVAEIVADAIQGRPPRAEAAALDPMRRISQAR